ncbi:MAG: YbbR-like domain-containing protein [Flavobacteriales bacterium]|nr:YbbR-like domain-containing protein [Flavobacteriales bacterium]
MSVKFKELLEFIKEYGRAKNYKVFLVFVMISSFFWLLIKFSKEYTSIVKFPVTYVSIPNGVVWGDRGEEYLYISTTTSGFQHLSYAFSTEEITLNLSRLRSLGNDQYFLLPKEQMNSIIQQVPSDLELTYRSPDSIFFDLSKKINKRIPVVLNDSLLLAPSFQFVEDIVISPDSITISGPSSMVSIIENVETELFFKDNIRKNSTSVVKLKSLGADRVEVSDNKVKVSMKVEQFTQNTINVPIIIRNVPKGYLLKIFPDEVAITFNTGLSNFESVKQSSFRVVADYIKIEEGNSQIIPLKQISIDNKIELIKFEPSEVEFLLRKID